MKNPDQFIYVQVCHNGVKKYLKMNVQFFFYRSKFSRDLHEIFQIFVIYSIITVLNENLVKMKYEFIKSFTYCVCYVYTVSNVKSWQAPLCMYGNLRKSDLAVRKIHIFCGFFQQKRLNFYRHKKDDKSGQYISYIIRLSLALGGLIL